jgi:small-conductance mechanosensitive channel
VKLRFDEAGVTIPFPQRELHFDALPTQGVDIDSQEDKMTPTNKEASA